MSDAEKYAGEIGFTDDTAGTIITMSEKEFATKIIYAQATNNPFEKLINDCINVSNFSQGGDGANFLSSFSSMVSDAVVPVAYAIAAAFFILGLIDLGMSERMNLELFTRYFTKLAVAIFMIDNADQFMNLANGITDWLTDLIQNSGANSTTKSDQSGFDQSMYNMIKSVMPDNGIGRILDANMYGVLGGLNIIPTFLILRTLLARLIEIMIRGAMMPIAFSFATEEGWRGTAIRYFKRYVALLVMGPLVSVVMNAGSFLTVGLTSMIQPSGDGAAAGMAAIGSLPLMIILSFVVGMAEVGAINNLKSVTSEMLGA